MHRKTFNRIIYLIRIIVYILFFVSKNCNKITLKRFLKFCSCINMYQQKQKQAIDIHFRFTNNSPLLKYFSLFKLFLLEMHGYISRKKNILFFTYNELFQYLGKIPIFSYFYWNLHTTHMFPVQHFLYFPGCAINRNDSWYEWGVFFIE